MRRSKQSLAVLGLLLAAACGLTPPAATSTPTPAPFGPTITPTPIDQAATQTPTAAPAISSPPATPTSLADGLGVRLFSTDPNPRCPDHYPWFFDNHADECAATILNTWTVWQPFERGLMVWTQEGGRTYVLLDDGSPFKPYQLVSDPVGVPFPDPDPSIVPPAGFFVPERGFALFWRNVVPGHEWVRERLGWATAPEAAYSGLWQCRVAGLPQPGPAEDVDRCYLNGPRDEIIVLVSAAAEWTYVQRAQR
jgi:hypothetical protein